MAQVLHLVIETAKHVMVLVFRSQEILQSYDVFLPNQIATISSQLLGHRKRCSQSLLRHNTMGCQHACLIGLNEHT